jgi:preprotein translocase subunit Sec63
MENYYKILGLKLGATLDEVEEKYNKLLKEFDPEKQTDELREFFTSESEKVKDAYKEISLSLVDNKNIEKVEDEISSDTNEIDSENEYLEESLAEEVLSDEVRVENNLNAQIDNNKKENYVFRNALLFFIAAGVWGMFMQNMGFFIPSDDDYTQKVRVVNTVDTEVQGSVRVNGSVSVDNTVDVNIDLINGYSSFYDSKGDRKYRRIPVYNFN